MTNDDKKLPEITVLMSCYNASRWLRDSIISILNQTFTDFEFIIIDDGSTDNTLEIIEEYAQVDSRLRVVKKANTGLGDSLNQGINLARGQWISRLDADDISEPMRFEQQIGFARSHPNVVFIGTGLTIIDEHGKASKDYHYPTSHVRLLKHLQTYRKFPPHSSAMFKTAIARRCGGYRPRIRRAEDLDLWLRLAEQGELACIDLPLVKIRKHADQISHDQGGKRQLIDAMGAMVTYWLRQSNFIEPEGDHLLTMLEFVERRLDLEGLIEANAYRVRINSILMADKSLIKTMLALGGATFLDARLTYKLIKHHLMGTTLPYVIAKEWINKQSVL